MEVMIVSRNSECPKPTIFISGQGFKRLSQLEYRRLDTKTLEASIIIVQAKFGFKASSGKIKIPNNEFALANQ